MIVVALESDPYKYNFYEQGLDVAMTLADLEQEIEVVLSGDFANAAAGADNNVIFKKKLLQLELFDIKCISAVENAVAKDYFVEEQAIYHVLQNAQRILTF